jgi:diguanylate cyclase (GGDEF)-like protein
MSQDQANLAQGPSADVPGRLPSARTVSDVERWVVWAQDGRAQAVLEQTSEPEVVARLGPRRRARLLYARCLAHIMLDDLDAAVTTAGELSSFCRDHGLAAQDLLTRSLLVELFRRQGRLEDAVEELARAVAQEPSLDDVTDDQAQAALGALAVALRTFGVPDEARRVEARLADVESCLPLNQRVSRWSNLAIEHVIEGMAAGRLAPFRPDEALLERAVEEIGRAVELADDSSYAIVVDEQAVIRALLEAVRGDPADALARLDACQRVLERGSEAIPVRLLWAAARVRALRGGGRAAEAVAVGQHLLATIQGSGEAGDRMVLAYEVLRAEHPDVQDAGSGAAATVALALGQARDDAALIRALFRARVDLWREADERLSLARRASLDSLTGLLNRRGAATRLAKACARPEGEPVAVLLLDLDSFRSLNDTCGHLAGDVVLQHVARALRAAVGEQDCVARWGGDAFMVISQRGAKDAMMLAEVLRERVRQTGEAGAAETVTASVGVCVRTEPVEESDMVSRAELALFTAKRAGGDGVVLR